jgi:hypothetical protein
MALVANNWNFTCVTSRGVCACAMHAYVIGPFMPAPVQGFEGFIEYSFALITRLMDKRTSQFGFRSIIC